MRSALKHSLKEGVGKYVANFKCGKISGWKAAREKKQVSNARNYLRGFEHGIDL